MPDPPMLLLVGTDEAENVVPMEGLSDWREGGVSIKNKDAKQRV